MLPKLCWFGPGRGERWALVAAGCYAGTNALLRASVISADPVIAATLRLTPVTVVALMLTIRVRGSATVTPRMSTFVSSKTVLILLLSGLSSYFVGNNVYQFALRFGGIHLTVPVAQSASLWGGILLGALWLEERFRRGVVKGGLVIMLGLLLITFSGEVRVFEQWYLALPLALSAGLSYALSNILIRRAYRYGMTQFPALSINALGGLAPLLIVAVLQQGPNIFASTSIRDLLILLAAGVLNAGALLSLSRALTLTTSSRVNTINTLSIALSSIFAVTVFHEPITPAIVLGTISIVAGIIVVQRHLVPLAA